jgi:hypothetical protein
MALTYSTIVIITTKCLVNISIHLPNKSSEKPRISKLRDGIEHRTILSPCSCSNKILGGNQELKD